jgi:light-regulated signal transduction histidine kinase (bacteriophytochrome)
MQQMLQALLQFSRVGRQPLVVATIDIRKVVAEALDSVRLRIEESGTAVEITEALPEVKGDPVLLGEVFVNLVSNAIKYNDAPEKRVTIGALPELDESGRVIFFVRDNGIGIRPKHHENIFQIFRRLHLRDAYGGGYGAGLAVVKSIVERHGGRIWVESEPGQGATFFFTLQAAHS